MKKTDWRNDPGAQNALKYFLCGLPRVLPSSWELRGAWQRGQRQGGPGARWGVVLSMVLNLGRPLASPAVVWPRPQTETYPWRWRRASPRIPTAAFEKRPPAWEAGVIASSAPGSWHLFRNPLIPELPRATGCAAQLRKSLVELVSGLIHSGVFQADLLPPSRPPNADRMSWPFPQTPASTVGGRWLWDPPCCAASGRPS